MQRYLDRTVHLKLHLLNLAKITLISNDIFSKRLLDVEPNQISGYQHLKLQTDRQTGMVLLSVKNDCMKVNYLLLRYL